MKRLLITFMITGLLGTLLISQTMTEEKKVEFVGALKCKKCHNLKSTGKYLDDWMTRKHYKTFFLLKGDEQKDPKCLKCHTTGYGEPGGFQIKDFEPPFAAFEDIKSKKDETAYLKSMLSTQCEMCHGPSELHLESKRGEKVIPHIWEPNEKTCIKCHNPESPNWKTDRYTDKEGKKSGFDFEQAIKLIAHKVEKKKTE